VRESKRFYLLLTNTRKDIQRGRRFVPLPEAGGNLTPTPETYFLCKEELEADTRQRSYFSKYKRKKNINKFL